MYKITHNFDKNDKIFKADIDCCASSILLYRLIIHSCINVYKYESQIQNFQ